MYNCTYACLKLWIQNEYSCCTASTEIAAPLLSPDTQQQLAVSLVHVCMHVCSYVCTYLYLLFRHIAIHTCSLGLYDNCDNHDEN